MTNLKILLDITNLKHLKEKSCYNHNFYEIITQSYGSMLFGNNILEGEGMTDERFSEWFKKNIPEKGLPENVTFTKQFLLDTWHNGYVCGCIEEKEELKSLEKENAELRTKVTALENANRAMVKELDDMTSGGLNALKNVARSKEQLEYAKAIIQDLLDNSDEYARQRAMDFLEAE